MASPQQRKTTPPSAPASVIDFFQAALFLEDPDLPKEQRISKLKFIGVIGVILAYISAASLLIVVACIVTPVVPALQTGFAWGLRVLTPPESWFQSAYEYQGPVARLGRFVSSCVMSTLRRRSSVVSGVDSMPALHRLLTRSSYAATM